MARTREEDLPADERAERLKERVYITFTALAVVLALRSHAESTTPGEAVVTLLIAVSGTLLAVLVADFVSHLAAHQAMPTRAELRHMIVVSVGAFGVLPVPLLLLGLAAADAWSLDRALRAATIALVASLVVIGYLAVRRVRMPVWQRVVVLGAEALLGVAVIGLELLAHG